MRAIRSVVVPLLLGAVLSAQDPPVDKPAEPKLPPVRVSVLEVVPLRAASIDTRRQSYQFGFTVERVVEDGAGVGVGESPRIREGVVQFRMYQGSDVQGGVDSASRLMALLETGPGVRDEEHRPSTDLPIGRKDKLTLTILIRPMGPELRIFEREDGARVVIEARNN